MDLRTYRASSLHEALKRVRADLGDEAAVLHTREVAGGLLGRWFFGSQIEVTASAEVDVPSRFAAKPSHSPPSSTIASPSTEIDQFRIRFRENLHRLGETSANSLEDLDFPSAVSAPVQPWQQTCLQWLQGHRISARYAQDLVARLALPTRRNASHSAPLDWREQLTTLLARDLQTTGPIQAQPGRCHRVALVGPTGVGKTTTIAKLAANFRLREKLRVGLITVDTYRIAAVQQLQTYADIMDLPMEVVATPAEMRSAVTKLADVDLVLIDTAGRSPRDAAKVAELQAILSAASPDEVQLVLSAVASDDALHQAIDRFNAVGATSIVLSKLDEAEYLGGVASVLWTTDLPLSYVTYGQNVPDDIGSALAADLAQRILPVEVPETSLAYPTA